MSGNCGPKADSEFDTLERCRKFLINHLYQRREEPTPKYVHPLNTTAYSYRIPQPWDRRWRPAGELAMGRFRKGELPAQATARWYLPISLQAGWCSCNTAVSLSG